MYATTTSARSTSSRSSSSRRTSESRRSNGPAKTSRSSSRSAIRVTGTCPGRLGGAPDGSAQRADPHRLAHVGDDRRGQSARLLGARLEDVLDRVGVLAQLRVALAHGRQPGGDLLADGLLELAVLLHARVLAL